jgi:pimeloyl-ACP methyl ester carboxylesterase
MNIAWEAIGDGPPLLLIHGLGYDRHGWGPLPQLLASDFRVLLFDNRGIGESDVPPGPYSTAEMAADALGVLDAAGIDRAHVIGTSLGGMVAQQLVLAAPERVDRLVLACTAPGHGTFPIPQRTLDLVARFPTLAPEEAFRQGVENALADRTVAERPELVEEIFAYRLAHPPNMAGWQAQVGASLGFDVTARLAEIEAPTLVQHGTGDHVVDVRNAPLLAEGIAGARLELYDDLGHLFFWEEPDRVAADLRGFLL